MVKDEVKRETENMHGYRKWKRILPRCLICFAVSFCLSGASYDGNCFVGGVALVGAAGGGVMGMSVLAGICLGYPFFFDVTQTIHYMAAAVFIYTVAFIFRYTRLYEVRGFMPIVSMIVIYLIRAFGAVQIIRSNPADITAMTIELILCGGLSYLYSFLFHYGLSLKKNPYANYSIAAFYASLIMGFCSLRIGEHFSVANICSAALSMYLTYKNGNGSGCFIPMVFGFALLHGGAGSSEMWYLYFLFGLSDLFPIKRSRLRLCLYHTTAAAVLPLFLGPSYILFYRLIETALAAVLFLLIPFQPLRHPKEEVGTPQNSLKSKTDRIKECAGLMEKISSVITESVEVDATGGIDTTGAFDRATDRICQGCEKHKICWEDQSNDIVSVLEDTVPQITQRGKLTTEDLPDYFKAHCAHHQSLVLAVNYELLREYDSLDKLRLKQAAAISVSENFLSFAEVLYDLTDFTELAVEPPADNTLLVEIGTASKKKAGERVCGDVVRYFKTDDNMLYVILSDGVGTGKGAHDCSSLAVSILEQAIQLLDDPNLAIGLANAAICINGDGIWTRATVDIAQINMAERTITFYKSGAAPSYIFDRDACVTVPSTLETSDNYVSASSVFEIIPGMAVMMCSDGVFVSDPMLYHEVIQNAWGNMKAAARQVALFSDDGEPDDKTVILLSFSEANHRNDSV